MLTGDTLDDYLDDVVSIHVLGNANNVGLQLSYELCLLVIEDVFEGLHTTC